VCLDTKDSWTGENDGPLLTQAHQGAGRRRDIVWKLDMRAELGPCPSSSWPTRPGGLGGPRLCRNAPTAGDASDEAVTAPKAPSFLAVNKHTGKVVWQDNSPGEGILHGQWSSPALGLVDGVHQVVFCGRRDGLAVRLHGPNRREALEIRPESERRPCGP